MIAPSVLPGRAFQRIDRVSRCLFHWRAADFSLDALTGQAATFARASAGGAAVGRNNLIRMPVHSQPRFQMEDLDGDGVRETPTLLLEAGRTNAFTYSEQLDNVVWSKGTLDVAANATTAPDGTLTADKIIGQNTATNWYLQGSMPGMTNGTLSTLSMHVKASDWSWLRIGIVGKDNVGHTSWFNAATGTFGTVDAGVTARVVEVLTDGWYRISCIFDAKSGGTTPYFTTAGVSANAIDPSGMPAADGMQGIYLWGLQHEIDKVVASSYVATTTATVARAADSLSWPFEALPAPMSVYARFVEAGSASVNTLGNVVWVIGKNDASAPRLLCYASSSGAYRIAVSPALGDPGDSADLATIPSSGSVVELLVTYRSNGTAEIAQVIDGGAPTHAGPTAVQAVPAAWSDAILWLNSLGSTSVGVNKFLSLRVAPGALTLQQMREIL